MDGNSMIHELDTAHERRFAAKYCDRWCYLGSSSKQESHQVQSNKINPLQMQQYNDNYTGAQSKAASLTPYTGPLTAGFTPTQIQSQGVLTGLATDPRYTATTASAMDATRGVLGANIDPNIKPQTYDPAQLAGTDLSKYLNPFTDNVVNTTLGDLQHARDRQQVSDNASATAAGAFGGTRQSVLNANTTDDYLRTVAGTSANLRSGAFTNAQNAALADIAAKNGAGQFNASQTQNAEQSTVSNTLASLGLKLNAAGQLEALNQDAFSRAGQQGGILASVGDTQQQQQQREFTDAYNAYQQGQQLTLAQQQILNQALGLIPLEQTNTTDGTTTTKTNPGMGGVLAGIGSLAMGAATGGASLGLTGAMGLGSSVLGSLTGSNAAGYGGMFGAAAPMVSQVPMAMPTLSGLSLPRYA